MTGENAVIFNVVMVRVLHYLSHWYNKFKCPVHSYKDGIKCLL
jgi:hypothetical protein